MIDAVVNYYGKIDAPITNKQVLITTGGSEALQIALSCILDEGDEIIIPEPFYPNYSTVRHAHRRDHPPHHHDAGGKLPVCHP